MTEDPVDHAAEHALDKRHVDVVEREAAVGELEEQVDAREAAVTRKSDGTGALLREAELRDNMAEFRDGAALHRDMSAAINDFYRHQRPDTGTLRNRGAAALDRTDARADRAASKKTARN
jgi:hypothetical protein